MIGQAMQCSETCVLIFVLLVILTKDSSQTLVNQPSRSSVTEDRSSSYYFYQQSGYPRDCKEVLEQCSSPSHGSVYAIKPDGVSEVFDIYCDSKSYTVIGRRLGGSISFNRSWEDYESGFGFPSHEFWLGNRRFSYLANQKEYQLRIDVNLDDGSTFFITYDSFRISDAFSNYQLISAGQYNETIVTCPNNMVSGSCTCQQSCADPDTCISSSCHVTGSCVCPSGFLMNDGYCIPRNQCSCFMSGNGQGSILQESGIYVSHNCTRRCSCTSGRLICEDDFSCSSHATCGQGAGGWNCSCNSGYEGDGADCRAIAVDCQEVFDNGQNTSGLYFIQPDWSQNPLQVYCNMADGGGWTVFQRQNGSENFYRNWTDYKSGFGSSESGLWLGNDNVYGLTNQKDYELRIDLTDTNGNRYYAEYNSFRINDEADKYRLVSVGTYTGNAGSDALTWHVNKQFSTSDEDNDGWSDFDCAEEHQGGWWFGQGGRCSDTYYYYYYCSYSYYRNYCNNWCGHTCYCSSNYWYCPNCRNECPSSESYCEYFPAGNSCAYCVKTNLNANYRSTARGKSIVWDGLNGQDCGRSYTEMKIRPVRS